MKRGSILLLLATLTINTNCGSNTENAVGDTKIESRTDEKVLLRFKPDEDKLQKGLVEIEFQGSPTKNVKVKISCEQLIREEKDEVYTHDIKYNSVDLKIVDGNHQVEFNSDKQKNGFIYEQFQDILANPIVMKVNELGEILQYDLPDYEANFQLDISSSIIPLPKDKVSEGEQWIGTKKIDGMGEIKLKMTLTKVMLDQVIISVKGTIIEGQKSIGTMTGEYTLYREDGTTKSSVVNIDAKPKGKPVLMKIQYKDLVS